MVADRLVRAALELLKVARQMGAKPAVSISGNLSEGFQVLGPYLDFDDAASKNENGDSWITGLLDTGDSTGMCMCGQTPDNCTCKEE